MLAEYASWLSWLNRIPPAGVSVLQALLPTVAVSALIKLFLRVLQLLVTRRRPRTEGEAQLITQRYHFAFLFVHTVLVVSIPSGLTATMFQIVGNVNSVAAVLARNFPKASNYFLSFLALPFTSTALTLSQPGAWLTQPLTLVQSWTPRRLLDHHRARGVVDWGLDAPQRPRLYRYVPGHRAWEQAPPPPPPPGPGGA
ncbi:hypothetical protein A1O3_00376 [Capronia epimyces CBS 606.96]|uniref:CSC1/OSCA1-like 7TM region domain-containing protein n=1 Tax=Capronia epimyces CBS 606.96 TaxID=1182542 RepID=W9YRD3_9EURO|nr:uncharacterized protein A1O3_00376 [Capronia epimyces CBS 606.96]EXJ91826.1 hypothetical protein A1O3_00376 [Capronia epimyces CBS 606.96]